jgi:hypothetical protein
MAYFLNLERHTDNKVVGDSDLILSIQLKSREQEDAFAEAVLFSTRMKVEFGFSMVLRRDEEFIQGIQVICKTQIF